MFNSLCATDLKLKVAQKANASMKTNVKEVKVHVTGPFQNAKLGKSHWVVVYGDNGQSWLLKAQFIICFIECLLSQVKKSSIDIDHCKTYYEINICQHEFGQENCWKKGSQVKLSKKLLLCIHVTQRKSSLENKV